MSIRIGIGLKNASPVIPPSTLLTGLVYYWKLNEVAGDALSSVGTKNGTVLNCVRSGTEYEFVKNAPIDYYVLFNTISGITVNTVSVWAKRDTLTLIAILYGISNNYGGIAVAESGNVSLLDSAGGAVGTWAGIWTDKTAWHNLTFITSVINATTGKCEFYFDGISQGILTGETNAPTFLTLGLGSNGGLFGTASGLCFDGLMKKVGLWNRVLTPAEITELNTGKVYPF